MNRTILEKADHILRKAQGNTLDVCYTLYCEYIKPSENPSEILQYILQSGRQIGTEDAPAIKVEEEEKNRVEQGYYKLLREIVRVHMRENIPVEEFYQRIYRKIFESDLFPQTDGERAVLLWLLSERVPEVPYYQAIGLLEKSDEEYREATGRVFSQLQQAVHMLNRKFASRTEEVSQFVRIASEIEDESDRIVYWSALIGMIAKVAASRGLAEDAK